MNHLCSPGIVILASDVSVVSVLETATIKTISNCTIGIIEKDKFFNMCEQNNTLGYQLLKNISLILSERIMDTNSNVMKLTTALCLILDQ